jgi:nucleolar protein 56
MPKLITTWFGVFLVEREKVLKQNLFPKDADEIAKRLKAMSAETILKEERELAKGVRGLKVADPRLAKLGPVSKSIKDRDISTRPELYGFSKDLLQEAMIKLGRASMKELAEDRYIIQAVKAIDDLNKTANLLSERLHEWYSHHYPEIGRNLPDERYAALISKLGDREQVGKEAGEAPSSSVGAPLNDEDRQAVMAYAEALDRIYRTRKTLERYIESRMKEVAPNITHMTGPVLGARLIALAGGLERLARLPSSTIQMLGAEKAFFKHLTEGGDMPKHGIIFQHPLLHASPHWQRGKIARAFASKIAIAAKSDSYSDKFLGEDLKKDLDKRIANIRKSFKDPPRPKGARGKHQRKGRSKGRRKRS